MEATQAMSGLLDFVLLVLGLGLPGLPAGERDPALLHAVPAEAQLVCEWSGRPSGQVPATSLDGLLAEPEVRDALAALQQFRTSQAGTLGNREALIELLSSQPGCFYLRVKPQLGLGLARWDIRQWIEAGVMLRTDGETAAVQQRLSELLPSSWTTPIREGSAPLLTIRPFGNYVIAGWGTNTAVAMEGGLHQPVGGLAGSASFQRAWNAVRVERMSSLIWLDLSSAGPMVAEIVRQQLGATTAPFAIPPGEPLLAVTGFDQSQGVSRFLWQGTNRVPRPVLSPAAFARIPADAQFVTAFTADLAVLWGPLGPILSRWESGETLAGQIREHLEQRLGLNLSTEFLPALGSTWTVYSAPSTGGAMGLSPLFSVDLRNSAVIDKTVGQIVAFLEAKHPADPQASTMLSREMFLGRTIYTLQCRGADWSGCAPSMCVTDQQLVFSLQPQTVRSHLRFLASGGPSLASQGLAKQPADAYAWLTVDNPSIISSIWTLLPYVCNADLNDLRAQGLNVSGSTLPSWTAIAPYISPSVGLVRRTELGLFGELQQPLSLGGTFLAAAAFSTLLDGGHQAPRPLPTPSAEGAPSVELGAAEGDSSRVTPAVATEPEKPKGAARPLLPGLLRSLAPGAEAFIPADVMQRLEEGPDAETLKRREERRKAREQRKAIRP